MKKAKRTIAIDRARELKARIDDYLQIRPSIPKGLEKKEEIGARQARIKKIMGATDEMWHDWH